ncbi:MAG: glycerophosphodiester phosphodiesterase [Polyangiaceae bacterium]|nr:glycerophosphodiester phosphodiesterase [Polyangiaceae bacterium]
MIAPDLAFWRRAPAAPPLVIGHRGAKAAACENTLDAFVYAFSKGARAVELDVRVCASGELVVFHDPTLDRLSDGRDARRVADLPMSDLGRVALRGGAKIPLLADVFDAAARYDAGVNVEMKHDAPDRSAIVQRTAREVRRVALRTPVIVSSFDPRMLLALKRVAPEIPRALLVHRRDYRRTMLAIALGSAFFRADFVHGVHIDCAVATAPLVRAIRARNLLVSVWTVNNPSEARTLADMGVDSVISDEPAVVGAAVATA